MRRDLAHSTFVQFVLFVVFFPPMTLCLKARWIFPVSSPPLRDSAVTIHGGRIAAVGSPPQGVAVKDLGNVALVPGFVNAHTHLEFSDLEQPIGYPGMGLVEWLGCVLRQRAESPGSSPAPSISAAAQGLRESLGYGVTTIGEIAQPGSSMEAYRDAPCGGEVFLELIAPRVERIEAAMQAAGEHTETFGDWRPGLSPHAPYTVHPELLSRAVALAIERRMPLAMHLAESPEEIEFLRDGGGPFRELLESRGAWDANARPRGARPLDELRALAQAPRALVIHGNYLDDEEIEFLGRQRNMAAVYCPRTHAWFGHAGYPLERLLDAGANVALGTDSRASSPDLSLLAEMRQVARKFPKLSRATILELGTLRGAQALGLDTQVGTLEPGKRANLAAVALPDAAAGNPHEMLLDAAGAVVATWVSGACRA
jgi:aminodeoxyfutalosine deaminase